MISYIYKFLNLKQSAITKIEQLDAGMTNESYFIEINNKKYICRLPGIGSSELVDRSHEYEIYKALSFFEYAPRTVYFDNASYIKISEYLENARTANSRSKSDCLRAMKLLDKFHHSNIKVNFTFDLYSQILKYESLMKESKYPQYARVKERVFALLNLLNRLFDIKLDIAHIDFNPDNILLGKKEEDDKINDFEYSAMQDQDIDIAMRIIYCDYKKDRIKSFIKTYHSLGYSSEKNLDRLILKTYIYIAACGLLWSNWCEYKNKLGEYFGNYERSQFNYALVYSSIATKEIQKYVDKNR